MNFLALLGLTMLAGLIGAGFAGVTITVFCTGASPTARTG